MAITTSALVSGYKCRMGVNLIRILRKPRLVFLSVLLVLFLYLDKKQLSKTLAEYKRDFRAYYYRYVKQTWNINDTYSVSKNICAGNFIIYGNEFARVKNVIYFPRIPAAFGIIGCTYDFKREPPRFIETMTRDNHLNRWINSIKNLQWNAVTTLSQANKRTTTTVAVYQYQFRNIFHQITEIFNAFLVVKYLGLSFDNVSVLLTDPHLRDPIEDILVKMFKDVTRLAEIKTPIYYSDLIWVPFGYSCPLSFYALYKIPYINEFSSYVKKQYKCKEKKLNCSKISILLISRKDTDGHITSRKLKNELEIFAEINSTFPGHEVALVQLELFNISNQIHMISETDILVGMHGAGMTHVMFLPRHAAVLELFPLYMPGLFSRHYRAMARYRGLHYMNFGNMNPFKEFENRNTQIHPSVVTKRLKTLYKTLCGIYPTMRSL